MDFSQSNRGYMFVRYTNPSDAQRAVRTLDNYEIKPKKFIGVVVSVDNRKLWINGIPKNKSADEIKVTFLPTYLWSMSSNFFRGNEYFYFRYSNKNRPFWKQDTVNEFVFEKINNAVFALLRRFTF